MAEKKYERVSTPGGEIRWKDPDTGQLLMAPPYDPEADSYEDESGDQGTHSMAGVSKTAAQKEETNLNESGTEKGGK